MLASSSDPASDPAGDVQIIELTEEQVWEQFDVDVRRRLQISGVEFVLRLDAGEYGDPDDYPKIMWLAFACALLVRAGFPR